MKKIIYLFTFLLLLFNQLEVRSQVSFKIKNAGFNSTGGFDKFTTDINYIATSPEKSTFKGTINVSSINTGIGKRDEHLRNKDYFDVIKYPNITFVSTSVKANGANKLVVAGSLTIKNVTKPVVLNVVVNKIKDKNEFSTSLEINRRDFGVGDKSLMLSDKLTISLKVVS